MKAMRAKETRSFGRHYLRLHLGQWGGTRKRRARAGCARNEEVKQWKRGMCVNEVLYGPMYDRLEICLSRNLAH